MGILERNIDCYRNEENKSYSGLFILPPELKEKYNIIDDDTLKKSTFIYLLVLQKILKSNKEKQTKLLIFRKKFVDSVNKFFTENNPIPLKELINSLYERVKDKEIETIRKENVDELMENSLKRKNILVDFIKDINEKNKSEIHSIIVDLDIEGRDYVFSEGTKLRILEKILKKTFPEYLEYLNSLKSFLEDKYVRLIIEKFIPFGVEFITLEGNKVYYFLKIKNIAINKRVEGIKRYWFSKREELIKQMKKGLYADIMLDIAQRVEKGLKQLDYLSFPLKIEFLKDYILFKALLQLSEDKVNLPSEHIEKLTDIIDKLSGIYAKQILDIDKLIRRIKEGLSEYLYRYTILNKKEKEINDKKNYTTGRSLMVVKIDNRGITPFKINRYAGYLKQMGIVFEKQISWDILYPFQGRNIGEILDIFLISYAISRLFKSVWFFMPYDGIDSEQYKIVKKIINNLMPNQTITERAIDNIYSVKNALLSMQKINRGIEIESPLDVKESKLIIYEEQVSNRIKEIVHQSYDRENLLSAHRVFKLFFLSRKGKLIELGSLIFSAGRSESSMLGIKSLVDKKFLFEDLNRLSIDVLFISKTRINSYDAKIITQRVLSFWGLILKNFYLVEKIRENYFLTQKEILKGRIGVYTNERDKKISFLHSISPLQLKNRYSFNLSGYSYLLKEGKDVSIWKDLMLFHFLNSDSLYVPFAEIKDLKLTKLGKIKQIVDGQERVIYRSILLIEILFRILMVENQLSLVSPYKFKSFIDIDYNGEEEDYIL